MAEYKKKQVKKVSLSKEKTVHNIDMRPHKKRKSEPEKSKRIKYSRAKPVKTGKPVLILVPLVIILLCIYLIILALHPVGVGEYISTEYKKIASLDYNSELSSGKIIDLIRDDSSFHILGETSLISYNSKAMQISAVVHGFSKPIAVTSETRTLIYGQGEKNIKIYNYNKELINSSFDDNILCADIADNGVYAVATYTSGYDSSVKVFDKKGNQIYEWLSADGIVSNITLVNDGKKILVTTFKTINGTISSKLLVLNYNSADAEYSFSFDNDIPYAVLSASKNSVYLVFENKVKHLNIKNGTITEKENEYPATLAALSGNKLVVVSSLSANEDKSHVTVFSKKGETVNTFSVDFPVKDVCYFKNNVYLLSEEAIFKADLSGKILSSTPVSLDIERIVPVSDRIVFTMNNRMIDKIELKENEK